MGTRKDYEQLVTQAKSQGWEVSRTKANHYRWRSPLGAMFFSSATPSDYRGLKNLKRDLRINGFIEVTNKKGRRS